MRFIDQETAELIDVDLLAIYSLEQLMEIAGLSVAQCIDHFLGEAGPKKILVLVGPGNNGGDGLVAARFLSIFGHKVSVHIPKITKFGALRSQCTLHGVNVIDTISRDDLNTNNDLIVDSIFGFGFKGYNFSCFYPLGF
jgi:NAD(P)H-hydrate epimerase